MLKDKLAIVTGGTRGIGYAVVEKFLENHATVVLCGSRQETADRAVEALKAKNPAWPVEGIAPELTDYASVRAAFQDVAERHGPIDILVNNAGLSSAEPFSGVPAAISAMSSATRLSVSFMSWERVPVMALPAGISAVSSHSLFTTA